MCSWKPNSSFTVPLMCCLFCKKQNVKIKIRIWVFEFTFTLLFKTEFVFYRVINTLFIFEKTKCQNQNPHLGFEIRICIWKTEFVLLLPHHQHVVCFQNIEMSKWKPVFGFWNPYLYFRIQMCILHVNKVGTSYIVFGKTVNCVLSVCRHI